MIGAIEILIFLIVMMGGLMLAMVLARALNVGKRPPQPDSVPAEAPKGDFDGIRTRVERRYRRRFELAAHFVMYLFIMGGLALMRVPSMALALIGGVWALVLAVHLLQLFFTEYADRAIEREIERERERVYGADKPKRDWQVRLSDEGELIDVIEDEPETDDKQKRVG